MSKRISQPPFPTPGSRIAIVGVTGCGKTTVAAALAGLYGLDHIELDGLYWGPGWQAAPLEIFRQKVSRALEAAPGWVVDGNYSKVRDLVWSQATTLVWLDYSLTVIYSRLIWRSLWRVFSRELLWNGNSETIRGQFFSRDSLLYYALPAHRRHRLHYPQLLSQPEYNQMQIIHARSPREIDQWLNRLHASVLQPA